MSALMNIQPGGLHPAAPRLTYVGLMVQFNRLDRTQPFDVYETRLYVVLLGFFNDRDQNWTPRTEQFADTFLCMATGIKSVNTVKKARAGLVERGLLEFTESSRGRGHMGTYRLLIHGPDGPPPALPALGKLSRKLSSGDSFRDSLNTDSDGKLSRKLSRKLSPDDTNINRVDIGDRSNGGAARLEKKIAGHFFSGADAGADFSSAADGAAGADEGTGGATDVATRIYPQPLEPGEYIRGGFVDERLPDSDPRKYEAQPYDAKMVNDYLASHPDPEIQKHAGKGQLFIDYYDGKGWCTGKEALTPIRNWRAVARQFSFRNYKAEREVQDAATGGSQVERRLTAAERVAEQLRKEASDE